MVSRTCGASQKANGEDSAEIRVFRPHRPTLDRYGREISSEFDCPDQTFKPERPGGCLPPPPCRVALPTVK